MANITIAINLEVDDESADLLGWDMISGEATSIQNINVCKVSNLELGMLAKSLRDNLLSLKGNCKNITIVDVDVIRE